jgi:ketosteroid isomerase-like protein
MNENASIIEKFYRSFKDKNLPAMLECYHEEVEFSDPVFTDLKGKSAHAMWMMLVERGGDLQISFKNVKAEGSEGSADWTAIYTFSKTNRKITNHIHAEFKFRDGKIVWHKDKFSLWKWAGMALGLPGYFLGFTPMISNQIRNDAQQGLKLYMKRKKLG